MEKCTKCKKRVKQGKGYPIYNSEIYCNDCYYLIRYRAKIKRREELRKCQKQ